MTGISCRSSDRKKPKKYHKKNRKKPKKTEKNRKKNRKKPNATANLKFGTGFFCRAARLLSTFPSLRFPPLYVSLLSTFPSSLRSLLSTFPSSLRFNNKAWGPQASFFRFFLGCNPPPKNRVIARSELYL